MAAPHCQVILVQENSIQTKPDPLIGDSPWLTARKKLFFAVVVLALAMSYFAVNVFQGAAVYYLTVGELLDRGSDDRVVRVNGALVPDTFIREEGGTKASFYITDGVRDLAAAYDGAVPDLFFNEHSLVVLEGQYVDGGVFQAQTILVKCPTKYEALAEEESA